MSAAEILAGAAERILVRAQGRPGARRLAFAEEASAAAGTADDLAHDVLRSVLSRRDDAVEAAGVGRDVADRALSVMERTVVVAQGVADLTAPAAPHPEDVVLALASLAPAR